MLLDENVLVSTLKLLLSNIPMINFNVFSFSAPTFVHGARISGLEARMDQVEDRICDLDARGSEEADNLANDRDLDRFILTGKFQLLI